MESKKNEVPIALYHTVGKYVALDRVSEGQEKELILGAMEILAVHALEDIRKILEDRTLDDPECFQRIDELVMLYFRELGVDIGRHNELE